MNPKWKFEMSFIWWFFISFFLPCQLDFLFQFTSAYQISSWQSPNVCLKSNISFGKVSLYLLTSFSSSTLSILQMIVVLTLQLMQVSTSQGRICRHSFSMLKLSLSDSIMFQPSLQHVRPCILILLALVLLGNTGMHSQTTICGVNYTTLSYLLGISTVSLHKPASSCCQHNEVFHILAWS